MGLSRSIALSAVLTPLGACTDDVAGTTETMIMPGSSSSGGPAAPTTGTSVGDDTTGTSSTGDGTSAATATAAMTTASASGDLSAGTSSAPAPCANGVQDQDETDVDCGGEACGACIDGAACEGDDDCASMACASGTCVTPECVANEDCAALSDGCSVGACARQTFTCIKLPVNDGQLCDDGDACTIGEQCKAGVCSGGAAKDCGAFTTACGVGTCDPKTGACVTSPDLNKDGLACDDANPCTPMTTCLAGQCGDPKDPGYVFHEDFAAPDPGWQLGQSWEIGPAMASPPGEFGTGSDPADDHSAGDDNRLAGQFIGGLVTKENVTLNQFNCLTSPPVDTSGLGAVWLTFWRHLHVDYAYFAVVRVEVWNGAVWTTVLEGYPPPVINDLQWKEIDLDLTAHKNPAMQVRICHQRNNGAYPHGGWSVDDVTIGPAACTP